MTKRRSGPITCRRVLFAGVAAGLSGAVLGGNLPAAAADQPKPAAKRQTVRDKLWIFTCPAGGDNDQWGLPKPSRMTPAEGAFYLNVPNLMMIRWKGIPPLDKFEQYAIPFRPLKRVAWSIVGSGGQINEGETTAALDLARRCPNIVGLFMDDFFHEDGSGNHTPQQLEELKKRMVIDGRKLDLYVVLYQRQMKLPIAEHLKHCDKITLWTWHAEELKNLQQNFKRLEKLAPNHGLLLGLYTWDYPEKRPVPMPLMKKQCELGLRWLREGRLEGMIFLANTVGDLDLEPMEYARKWIAEVGDQPL